MNELFQRMNKYIQWKEERRKLILKQTHLINIGLFIPQQRALQPMAESLVARQTKDKLGGGL